MARRNRFFKKRTMRKIWAASLAAAAALLVTVNSEFSLNLPMVPTWEEVLEAAGSYGMENLSSSSSQLPQGGESFAMDPHSGEEFGYIIEGSVVLISGEKSYTLHKGETFYLSGKNRHYLKNEKKTTAKVLWISTPPLF